ncbi:PfkB family carbohydrate kinase [Sulfuriflexus mobilis]|uniref:PfkB family carbohydrate kinase n=1 Tax=Sulfuriflexus mobilis TaxID=1811807 RepID=UPI000F841DB7|nr:PfkB family carbohydrate kinase [Sulfuriflexus mobilis]
MFEKDGRPVIFGEVLFDVFEDGGTVLGGAAFNVAWHLQGFGLRPLLISRIGQDKQGELALMCMRQWDMDTRAVQIDPTYPTGRVDIAMQDGKPRYQIPLEQAYDKISRAMVNDLVSDLPCSLLYCGSLAQRDAVSRQTLQSLIRGQRLPVFVDINRRAPWLDEGSLGETLNAASYLKMNEAELASQTGERISNESTLHQAAARLCQQYQIEHVIITRGDKGACHISAKGMQTASAQPTQRYIDNIGADDAFTAVTILGQIRQWPISETLLRANRFAARLCEQRGSLLAEPSVYADLLRQWA